MEEVTRRGSNGRGAGLSKVSRLDCAMAKCREKRAQVAATSSLSNLLNLDLQRKCKAKRSPGWDRNWRIASFYGGFARLIAQLFQMQPAALVVNSVVNSAKLQHAPLGLDSSCPRGWGFWFLDLPGKITPACLTASRKTGAGSADSLAKSTTCSGARGSSLERNIN